ncbi:Ankyrin repeat, SAM and basic leucine zipper domain-containing protein 1 [Folsomia candida]|uniref:Ankyrin repeat, SAM and basic leucine zipper domain-containing protein 1 n=1 Tax=Folsomia candida TaxID=158441 RepID=A0A226EC52_FOLCA|nr:Ankyrin repeat, SAM and basic leucine zipper domain-containing protein 1 [Folsomia candida]
MCMPFNPLTGLLTPMVDRFLAHFLKPVGMGTMCPVKMTRLDAGRNQAEACQTVPYCIHCKWNDVIIPTMDKCQMCQDEINTRQENETDKISLLKHACKLHGKLEDVEKCVQLIRNLDPILIGT